MQEQIQKNIIYRLAEAILTSIILLAQYSLLAKHLSFNEFGSYALGMFWSSIFIGASYSFGLPTILSRELCQRDQHQQIISSVFFSQFLLGLLTLAVTLPSLLYLNYFQDFGTTGYILFITSSLLLAAPITMQGILISQEKMLAISIVKVSALILNYAVIFFLARAGLGLQWIFASHLTLTIIFAVGFYSLSNAKIQLSLRNVKFKEIKYTLIQASPIVLMTLVAQVYGKIDIVMVDILKGKEQVAIYASAYKLLEYLLMISNALILATFPNMMKAANDLQTFKLLYKKLIKMLVIGLFPVAALVAIMAKPLIGSIYGEVYQTADSTLRVLMLAGCVSLLNAPSSTILIAYKKQHLYLIATLLSLVVNVAGNYVLIPIYDFKGAAIATLITEVFMLCFCLSSVYKLVRITPFYSKA